MKRVVVVLFSVLLLAGLAWNCGGEKKPERGYASFFPPDAPDWVKHGAGVFRGEGMLLAVGVGDASSPDEIGDAQHEAYVMARRELAAFLGAKISAITKRYFEKVKSGKVKGSGKFYQDLVKEVIKERTIVGAKTIDSYTMQTKDGGYLVWVLLGWDPEAMAKVAEKMTAASSAYKRVKAELMKSMKDLEKELTQPGPEDKEAEKKAKEAVQSVGAGAAGAPAPITTPKVNLNIKLKVNLKAKSGTRGRIRK